VRCGWVKAKTNFMWVFYPQLKYLISFVHLLSSDAKKEEDWDRHSQRNEPIQVGLDRPHLELLLLARHLMHAARFREMKNNRMQDNLTDPVLRQWAVVEAQTMLTADRASALAVLAAPIFRGERDQQLRQLDWLLDGQEPKIVVCRHCYYPVDKTDTFLALDAENKTERHERYRNDTPRYSAHAVCYEEWQHSKSKLRAKPDDHYWSQYKPALWVDVERYRLAWAIEEGRSDQAYFLRQAAEAANLTGQAQSAIWAHLCSEEAERDETQNDLVVGLSVDGAAVRLEVRPDKQTAVVSFRLAQVYRPGDGPMFSDVAIPSAVIWRSIMTAGLTQIYGWATSFDYDNPASTFEAARVILTFAVTGDDVVITFDSRCPQGSESTSLPLGTLRTALGQDD